MKNLGSTYQNKYSLPTPEENKYGVPEYTEEILAKIRACVIVKQYEFTPDPTWNFQKVSLNVNKIIGEFGWKLSTGWHGDKDRGYSIWKITPKEGNE